MNRQDAKDAKEGEREKRGGIWATDETRIEIS
jgi:hypothetical protein